MEPGRGRKLRGLRADLATFKEYRPSPTSKPAVPADEVPAVPTGEATGRRPTRRPAAPGDEVARRTIRPDTAGLEPQASVIWSPSTLICCSGSGSLAGPAVTEPSSILNLLPWQGQSIVPFATLATEHP